jgi:hypothetical protein
MRRCGAASSELREVLRANQRDGYAALMKATAEAIIVSATQGFGIAPGAIMLRAPVSS